MMTERLEIIICGYCSLEIALINIKLIDQGKSDIYCGNCKEIP